MKEIEKKKRKMGPPEDMTVCLLKEVLDSLNVTFRSNQKKAELIPKVRQACENLQEGDTRSTSTYTGKKQRSKFKGSLTLKSNITCLYYCDDRKEKLFKILVHLLFLLEIVGTYRKPYINTNCNLHSHCRLLPYVSFMRNELFCSLDSVASYLDEGVIFLAIRSSQFTINTCGNSCYKLLTRRCVPTLVNLRQTSLLRFCSLVAVKVTLVVSSNKNIFTTV